MKDQNTAAYAVQAFCESWFEQRDTKKAVGFLAPDISFIGTGSCETANGVEEMARYIQEDVDEMAEPFCCTLSHLHQQLLAGRVTMLSADLTLKNTQYTWHLRAFFALTEEAGRWRIGSMHVAEPGRSQRGREHYPQTLVMEAIVKQRQELLNESFPGGMMGGYIEEGFPFYFVNQKMLDYLGYRDEAEFVADIGGLISNCMHPDDQRRVDRDVEAQLSRRDEYVVEYRMKKRDGSYIWVHDLGRKTIAEDGRSAIFSVCIDINAQKQAQDEVMRLYNNIPGAVFRCRYDENLPIIDANDGLFDFLGYTREEFAAMGNRMADVFLPGELEPALAVFARQLEEGSGIQLEHRLQCKGGVIKWVSVKAQMVEEDGQPYLYCVFMDVTEEKQLQQRTREMYQQELAYFAEVASKEGSIQGTLNVTANRVESYLSTADVAVGHVGDPYRTVIQGLANSAVDEAYGAEILGTLQRDKVLADYAAGRVDYHFEFLRRRNDGTAFWGSTRLRACLNPESGDVILFFYTMDVTEQRLQERLLNRIAGLGYESIMEVDIERDTYRMISFQSGSESLFPPQGRFQPAIRAVAEARMEEAARGEYLENLRFDVMRERLARQDAYSFVVEAANAQGEARVKRFQVFYISEELQHVCVARTDLTDLVQQEQKQKEELAAALIAAKQANAAKTDFLSRMSHEIRTPMNAIIGMTTIAAQAIGDDEQVEDCIAKIGISSRFLLSLINDILDMSRIESGKMLLKNEKIPMAEFINGLNSICYAQAAAKQVEYECIVDPVMDDYYIGDAMKLQQVLLNILSNAIKFTSEGGKVTFSAAQRQRTKNSAALRFIINDTGVGMNEEFLPHIFEPFSQESTGTTAVYGGTGLGLAISKNIVDMMDGNIKVRSIKGVGTEFAVDVKLGISEEEKLRHNQKKPTYNFSHLKTLVVDDDVAVCESAIVTLREMGVVAEWVDSGRKAIEQVRTLWGAGKYYDMILIDWKMPDMDGIETARRIRAIVGPEVTIIIMTAYDWVAIEHEAKLAGVNLLMSKPMFKSSLVSAFTRAMGEKEEQKQQAEVSDFDFAGKRVLLAEDNAINTEVALLLLESKGFAVETAENGLRAMELFSKSEPGYYNAILMDIRMPVMDGLEATKRIRTLGKADSRSIPIVAMTANAFDEDTKKSMESGMDGHLSKPIQVGLMMELLGKCIGRHAAKNME